MVTVIPLLTQTQCQTFIGLSDIIGNEEVYFCKGLFRGMFTCSKLANLIYDKIANIVNEEHFIVNDHFRLSRYEPNTFLALHQDRPTYVNSYVSKYTINIFLNTIPDGGTSFWSCTTDNVHFKHRITYDAIAGNACIFNISEYHRGEPSSEKKYLLRTDILVRV